MTVVAPEKLKPLTKAQMQEVNDRLTRAKAHCVMVHPFFYNLLAQRPIIVTETVPTAAADAKGRIYVNPRFALQQTTAQMVFLMCHEVLHIAFLHCHKSTIGGRKPGACNIAMDKVINETLIASQVGEFIPGGQRHPGAENMKWQDLYNEDEGGGNGGIGDDLIDCPDGEPGAAEASQIAEETKVQVAAASAHAKKRGKMPVALERMVEQLLFVPTRWDAILERFMTQFVSSDYSWKRPNRRFTWQNIYLPSLDRQPRMGTLVIGTDESGSVSDREFQVFMANINRIIELCVPERVILIHADARVARVDEYTPEDYPVPFRRYAMGGTDMRVVWQHIEDNDIECDCMVLFTDGETPWPDSVRVPSLVVSTTDQVAPDHVGETIKFSL